MIISGEFRKSNKKKNKMKKTLILDSTQIHRYLECPRAWFLKHTKFLELNGSENVPLHMGSYGHVILENYYKKRASGIPMLVALEESLNLPARNLDEDSIQTVKRIIVSYVNHYGANDFIPASPDSVEVGFSYVVHEDEDRLYILEGKLDSHSLPMVGSMNGHRTFMDHKFQMRERELYKRRIQFNNYALATDSIQCVVNYIRFHKNLRDNTFVRQVHTYSRPELAAWRKRLIQIYDVIQSSMDEDDMDGSWFMSGYAKNEAACEGKFGYPCEFSSICEEEYNGPMVQQNVIDRKFHKIEEWKPW